MATARARCQSIFPFVVQFQKLAATNRAPAAAGKNTRIAAGGWREFSATSSQPVIPSEVEESLTASEPSRRRSVADKRSVRPAAPTLNGRHSGGVGESASSALFNALAIDAIHRELPYQKASKDGQEKHEHPKAALGSAG